MRHGLRDIFIDEAMLEALRQLADAAKVKRLNGSLKLRSRSKPHAT
jgi:hypothetical protein